MKAPVLLLGLVCLVALALPSASLAQRSAAGPYGRPYDIHSLETVSGQVLSVEKIAYGRRGFYGVHLLLRTAHGKISVHLGPSWFVDRQRLRVEPYDTIEVVGSKVQYQGQVVLIAAEVRKGADKLVLRDSQVIPVWSRWRRQ